MNLEAAHREMRVIARESEEFIKGSYGQERFKSTTMVNARIQEPSVMGTK